MLTKSQYLPSPEIAERMAPRSESAPGVERNTPANSRLAAFGHRSTLAGRAQPEHLGLNDFADRGGVVHLRHADILWSDARLLVGLGRSLPHQMPVQRFGRTVAAGLQH